MKLIRLATLTILIGSSLIAQIPVAVLDFEANGISNQEVKALTDRFRNEMFKFSQYDMMERGNMEDILKEQGFQMSGCVSDACVVEVGKLVGVQQMVGGSIGRVGNVFTVSARIMSVESGQIIKTANYDHTGDIGNLLTSGMYKVAALLAGEEAGKRGAVAAGNTAPEITAFTHSSAGDYFPVGTQVTFTAAASNPDWENLTITYNSGQTFTLPLNQPGSVTVTATVRDGNGGADSQNQSVYGFETEIYSITIPSPQNSLISFADF